MLKIAINGFGRIGRAAFKIAEKRPDIEVKAINDLTDNQTLAHLLQFDSVFNAYDYEVQADKDNLYLDQKAIPCSDEPDPGKLPWQELDIDIVLECTGIFKDQIKTRPHLEAGAKRVIISAPPKDDTKIFCLGCNEQTLDPEKDLIISNASCTTNCLAPVAKVINDQLGIEKALMTTIHSYTSTQNLVDGPNKDLRRARAAAVNLIPTTTGAAIAVTQVLPELEGKFDGMAIRVPTPCVSLVDAVMQISKPANVADVNRLMTQAAQDQLKGILSCETRPLVSSDFIGNPYSSIVDLEQTMVQNKNLVKIIAWYDNEWGYAQRLVDLAQLVGENLKTI
ncbi:MAG: type I glyceraldehyde-3-phosphate dehydrogenase [Candidatus Moranbacteria bacterium]|nr:type I glyceraldehyde-3-phosphate dehydrogenase [Candidatus Moranbacteria bacterium]